MRKPSRAAVSVRKASWYAVVTNAIELVLVLGVAVYMLVTDNVQLGMGTVRLTIGVASLMVAAAAVLDIRDALQTRRLLDQIDAMDVTIGNMEQFNNTLRAQRHDFLNHLQVVYSLIELGDYEEANAYIDRVYGAITSVSRVMKTASAPVNALLQAKVTACEQQSIPVEVSITSSWKGMGIPDWEMCKVLGNLIDNAMDALSETDEKRLSIQLTEDIRSHRFTVSNSGPSIPAEMMDNIFEPGVTTKAEGHGMGLYIVRSTLRQYGGDISVTSDETGTVFSGYVPREVQPLPSETKE